MGRSIERMSSRLVVDRERRPSGRSYVITQGTFLIASLGNCLIADTEAGGQHRTATRPVQERLWRSTSSVLNRPQRGKRGARAHADQARDTSSAALWAVSAAAARC